MIITTEQVIERLKEMKPNLDNRPFSKLLIEKYYDQLITDSEYITQTMQQAINSTDSDEELIEFLVNDYIGIAIDFEYTNVKTEMKKTIKLK